MKWTLSNIYSDEIFARGIKEETGYGDKYTIPIAQILAYGEPTTYFVTMSWVDAPGTQNFVLEVAQEVFVGGQRAYWKVYRPFTKKLVKKEKNMEALLEIIKYASWYLENWDLPACKSYKETRGRGGEIKLHL